MRLPRSSTSSRSRSSTRTDAIRDRVLAAWGASPSRFREDANAEEDASYGAPLVELAQNAADAALRAGVPGRLFVEVVGNVLYAANTGAPLDEAGVEALCHLRASTKDAASVGRYGVGFKAVLAWTDSPAILGRDGGVCWSRDLTSRAVASIPSLAAEVARREGVVPVMRLPYDATPDPHATALLDEYDTVVVLPLRGPVDLDVDEHLLLTLPLDSLTVAGHEYRRDPTRPVHTVAGTLPPELLADRPVEERERAGWSVTVALPAPDDRLLRAPQRTDERVDVPVFLSASVPLEPSRRHVVHGPLSEWLAARAAEAYVALLESLPHTPDVLDLVPSTLPGGPFDLALREALAPLLETARVFPEGARAVLDLGPASDAATNALGLPLLDGTWLRRRAALAALGVKVLDTADVVDLLHGMEHDPPWWATVYEALANVPDRDALRALPVPLADGRVVTGPRGLLMGDPVPGLRFVHPEACTGRAAEVLRGAGAEDADPGAILDALRADIEASLDDEPPDLADTVLRLLRNAPTAAEGREWIGSLALPDEHGDLRAADELLLPGTPLVRWMREDSPFGIASESLAQTYGSDALVAAGVVAALSPRDLDEVRADAWTEALGGLTSLDDETLDWLRANVLLPATDGTLHPPRHLLAHEADPLLAGLYERLGPLPAASLRVVPRLGLLTRVEDMDDTALADLADRIATRDVTLPQVRALYAAIARGGVPLDPPRVVAMVDGALRAVAVDDAYAVDRPDLLPLLAGLPWLPVDVTLGRALADVLGVRLASEIDARITSARTSTARLADLAPGAPDVGVDVHDDLRVNDVRVTWSLAGRTPAVDGTPAGVARLVAWLTGSWPGRHAIEASLRGERDDESLLDPT